MKICDAEKVCLLDMDGTVADLMGAYVEANNLMRSPHEPDWNPAQDPWPDYIKNRLDIAKKNPGFWQGLKKLEAGFQIMNTAVDIGYDINVLTKGPYRTTIAWMEKANWCRENLPEGTKITITEDKGLSYGRVLVDDYPPYIERWLQWRPRGLVIQPLHGYNTPMDHPNVVVYDGTNLEEIRRVLQVAYDRKAGSNLYLAKHVAPHGFYRVVTQDLDIVADCATHDDALAVAHKHSNDNSVTTFVHNDTGGWIETYFATKKERENAKGIYGDYRDVIRRTTS